MPVLDEVMNPSAESANQANLRLLGSKRFATTAVLNSCEADLASVDLDQLEVEDKLGCARGVLWSLIFEAAMAAGAVLLWKCHFFSH
jgi:hypothetical protein